MKSGDATSSPSVENLYYDHHVWLQGWLRRRLGNAADLADLADLAQDAFLRLLIKPASGGFGSELEARAYLRTLANGMCIALWRRREVEQPWLDTLTTQPEALEPSPEHRVIIIVVTARRKTNKCGEHLDRLSLSSFRFT
ncbi:hypothetical protein LCGC14_0879590 [marine sediment metagenome]|uniref:RNA polymerase sigma-70 region 2 domain-containing protein n=1 Tax=marine sediment metagenome TaxID=412755 RepID=A0A0F9RLT9_9ZZZZ|nr:RNA polymerase subunit sigma [Methylophaga sp.]